MYGNILKIFCLLALFFAYFSKIAAQVTVDSIVIKDKVYTHHHLKPTYQFKDSTAFITKDFLHNISSGQIQMNTPGGLLTFLHRGMGNRHLPILWHGINIQNTINGSYDLSLIPTGLMNSMAFYGVGNPSLQGNNGFAGSIDLLPSELPNASSQLFTSFSTLQNYTVGIKTMVVKNKYSLTAGLESSKDQNIYSYNYNGQKYQRESTNTEKHNVIIDTKYYLSNHQELALHLWYQNSHRNIPVSITQAPIEQRQWDSNIRAQVSHMLYTRHHKLTTSFTYMKERLDFTTANIDSRSHVDVIVGALQWSELNKDGYYIGLNFRKDVANPNFFRDAKHRTTLYLSGAKKMVWSQHLVSNISIRQDLVDDQWMPFSWTLHTDYKRFSFIMASNYNLPGFNDLYWPTGGNTALKTEKSTQAELKYKLVTKHWQVSLTSYAQLVRDWIQWVPSTNGIWSPTNQKKVLSRGLDIMVAKDFRFAKWHFLPDITYSMNGTSALAHYTDPSQVGKQLIYVPRHKVALSLKTKVKSQYISFNYTITGKRFDTTDESQTLDPIHLLNVHYGIHYRRIHGQLSIENLLNQDYQITRFFPLPGINATTKITYYF